MANTYLPSTLNPERVVTSCVTFADAPCVGFFLSKYLAKSCSLTILKKPTQKINSEHSLTVISVVPLWRCFFASLHPCKYILWLIIYEQYLTKASRIVSNRELNRL